MYRCDAVGVQLAALVDRDVFARDETLICEVKPDLIRHVLCGIVVERPAATLTMNKVTMVVLLIRPQSCDPACLAMLPPERRIDPVVLVERRNDDIGDAGVAFGVPRFSRQLNANLPKLCRKGCIQDRFGRCVLHVGIASLFYRLEANAAAIISVRLRLPPQGRWLLPVSSGS